MSTLTFNYSEWSFWGAYNPPEYLGEQKVTFDGPNKLILVNADVTLLDFKEDVYSAWKEWLVQPTQSNQRYLPAITAIGGDPLPGSRVLGTTYFLENGWRMRTWEGDHSLTINGNIFTREGDAVFVPTLNPWTITINLNTSTLVEVVIPTISLTNNDIVAVANSVWNEPIRGSNTALDLLLNIPDDVWDYIIDASISQSAQEKLRKIATKVQDIALS